MMEERQLGESGKTIKELFPDGKIVVYIFRIPSKVYKSVNEEIHKKETFFTKIKRMLRSIFY